MLGDERRESARVAARVRALLDAATQQQAPPSGAVHAPYRSGADGRLADEGVADEDVADVGWSRDNEPAELVPPVLPAPPGVLATLGARLAERLPVRLDPGRRGALAVGFAVVCVVAVVGVWLVASRPQAVPVRAADGTLSTAPLVGTAGATSTGTGGTTSASVSAASSASSAPSSLVVDVAGKVRHPGVYRLPAGSRIDDALRAAGGANPGVDLSALDLAAVLVDGEQVPVGIAGATPAGGAPQSDGTSGSGGSSAPVDLNTATLEQLETLPGVGPVLGQNILDYRSAHGSFHAVSDLKHVTGIGDVRFAQLQPHLSVG